VGEEIAVGLMADSSKLNAQSKSLIARIVFKGGARKDETVSFEKTNSRIRDHIRGWLAQIPIFVAI
jgi:hypothetical protein